jgi:hypothetical protein
VGALVLFLLTCVVTALKRPPAVRDSMLPGLIEYFVILLVVLGIAVDRLSRWMIIEIDQHDLAITRRGSIVRGTRRYAWPREDVLDVHVNHFNHKLIVRVRGRDFLELFVSTNRDVANFVGMRVAGALAATYEPGAAPAVTPNAAAGMAFSAGSPILVLLGCAIAVVGIVCLLLLPPLGIALLVAAAVPLGLAFGTQEKDVWV